MSASSRGRSRTPPRTPRTPVRTLMSALEAAAGAMGHRLQSSSAEDMVKSGGGDVDVDDPETHAVVEVQFVTNQVPAKRVSAQLGELMGYVLCQTRSKMKCTAIV